MTKPQAPGGLGALEMLDQFAEDEFAFVSVAGVDDFGDIWRSAKLVEDADAVALTLFGLPIERFRKNRDIFQKPAFIFWVDFLFWFF